MDNLYVHLQSDSSPSYFPHNKITDFRNQLATPLDIDPTLYEVALVQCSYVYNPPWITRGTRVGKLSTWYQMHVVDFEDDFTKVCIKDGDVNAEVLSDRDFIMTKESYQAYKAGKGQVTSERRYLSDGLLDIPEEDRDKEHVIFREKIVRFNTKKINTLVVELILLLQEIVKPFNGECDIDFPNKKILIKSDASEYILGMTPGEIIQREFGWESFALDETKGIGNTEWTVIKSDTFFQTPIDEGSPVMTVRYIEKEQDIGPLRFTSNNYHRGKHIKETFDTLPFHEYRDILTKTERKMHSYQSKTNIKSVRSDHDLILYGDAYDIDSLLKEVNYVSMLTEFYKENNKVMMKQKFLSSPYRIKFDESFLAILGLNVINKEERKEEEIIYTPEYRPFFGHGQQKMYIYVDIIENQFIGGQLAPILRVTDYSGDAGKTVIQEFAHNQYIPLRNVNLDQIHMYIKSETGENLPIELGAFTATLHFRKKRI
ncbi:unnamed protein product [Orchesella dallaii]|uniref:PAS domain-containing protein n=1 Tax=Orchesella dallaii TaxID=48710 RepID=A0ABP1QAD9_9HEXA